MWKKMRVAEIGIGFKEDEKNWKYSRNEDEWDILELSVVFQLYDKQWRMMDEIKREMSEGERQLCLQAPHKEVLSLLLSNTQCPLHWVSAVYIYSMYLSVYHGAVLLCCYCSIATL